MQDAYREPTGALSPLLLLWLGHILDSRWRALARLLGGLGRLQFQQEDAGGRGSIAGLRRFCVIDYHQHFPEGYIGGRFPPA